MVLSPLVSIIVPAYNIERYIKQCIDSVLCQKYISFELIIINDGSKDGTEAILKELEKTDNRIVVINKENGGVSSARYEGLKIAKGDYVLFVDGDDWLTSDCLLKVYDIILKHEPDVICFGELTCNRNNIAKPTQLPQRSGFYDKATVRRDIFPELISGKDGTYFSPSLIEKCFKRELCSKYMLVHKEATIGEDGATVIPCIVHANSIYIMEECLYYYRYNESSATKSRKVYNWFYPEIINRHIEDTIDINYGDFKDQMSRKITHDVFNVVVTRFYQNLSYSTIVADINDHLANIYYKYAIEQSRFSNSFKHSLMKSCLHNKWLFLVYLYSKIK